MKKYSMANLGFTIADFILILLLIIFMVVPLGLIFPTVIDYYTLKKTVTRIQKTAHSEKEAQDLLNNQFMVDTIRVIKPEDIEIVEENGKLKLSFDYKQPIPLYANISLLAHYKYTAN